MPTMKTTTTTTTRRTTRTKQTTSQNDLATKLESTLTIRDKPPSNPPKQPSRVEALPEISDNTQAGYMRAVNSSLHTLSSLAQTGWKYAPGTKSPDANATKAVEALRTAKKALGHLRGVCADDLDVERAACSMAGKLITLEMYDQALALLSDMYPHLLRIADPEQARSRSPSPSLLQLLALPRPPSLDSTVLILLTTSITHALNAHLYLLLHPSPPFSPSAVVTTLQQSHSLLAWAPYMKHDKIPEKTSDGLLTRAYSCTTKVCTALSSDNGSVTDPESIFLLRIYALSCLLYTTPGTIKSTTFWDQVHRACLSYARTFSSNTIEEHSESAFAAYVSGCLSEIVQLAQGVHGREFAEGRYFVQLCETWMGFAKKGGDIAVLEKISEFMGVATPDPSQRNPKGRTPPSESLPSAPSNPIDNLVAQLGELKIGSEPKETEAAGPVPHQETKDTVLVDCSRCCGTMVKVMASLESEGPDLARHAKQAAEAVCRYPQLIAKLSSFASPNPSTPSDRSCVDDSTLAMDADIVRARGKVERALERLRRAALRILDAQPAQSKDSRDAAVSLLEVIATTLEDSLTQGAPSIRNDAETKDTLTALLDVLFVLARTRLDTADIDSYTPALRHLERAVVAVNVLHPGGITVIDAASLLRCTSGALHNLGGALYAAGRLGAAVRFLKDGCAVGRRVLEMYAAASPEGQHAESDREKEGRRQLEEQLFRRYELLGVCHSKIGDRKLAYEALIESIQTFPYSHYPSTFSSADPFAPSTPLPLKQLSSIIERATYTATCELFLSPPQITLRPVILAAEANNPSTSKPITTLPSDTRSQSEIIGAIISRQLATLESITHKDGVREAIWRILQDLLAVYDASWAPIQRAQVLLTGLGVSWRDGRNDVQGASAQFDPDLMGKEALELLVREIPSSDSRLNLVPQLTLSVHMWLALHAYRRSPSGSEMMSLVAKHVDAAYTLLSSLQPGSEKKVNPGPSPKAKKPSATGSQTRAAKSNNAAPTKGRSVSAKTLKKAVVVEAAKPPPRQALRAVSMNTRESAASDPLVPKKIAHTLDLQPLLGLIQMNVHLLGLLGLIVQKVKLLEILKRLCEHQAPVPVEAYTVICVDLAHEYIRLGKSKRAGSLFNKCANFLRVNEVPDDVRLQYLLGHAEVLALGDNVAASASAYCEAQDIEARMVIDEKTISTAKRVRMRVERLERAALACRVFAAVQYSKDNVVGALFSMLQSLRLWNRAVEALSRLSPPNNLAPKPTEESSNPFDVSNNDPSPSSPSPRSDPTPSDALSWRLLSNLVSTLFSLAQGYYARGSPRESLYFIQQVTELAESTRSPAVVARACIMRGELYLASGEVKEGREALEKAAQLLGAVPGIEAAYAQRLRGDYGMLRDEEAEEEEAHEDPKESYERAWRMLDELEGMIGSLDGGRRKSSLEPVPKGLVLNGGQGMVVPRLLSGILRRHIWLLRNEGGEVFKHLVERLMALPPSAEIKGEEHLIMGKLTMHSVYEQFRSDMFLSSLSESTIALPMGMSGEKDASIGPATQDILSALVDAEKLFWADLTLTTRRGAVPHVREATISLALIRALQTSLGKASSEAPLLAARLLDASSAITLHREMLEAIPHKFDMDTDDLQWPLMTTEGSPLPSRGNNLPVSRRRNPSHSPSSSSSPHIDEGDSSSSLMRSYWSSLEKKYTSLVLSPSSLVGTTTKLPRNWTVIHMTLTPDKSTMFISRLHTDSQPLLFCVPLRGRRDTDDDEESRLTLEDALRELQEIVQLSDEGTRRAAHVKNDDPQARAGWWAERAALDKRLQALLENIEFCWLGAFKTILSPPAILSSDVISDLRARLERVFKRSLPPQDKKKVKLRLDESLLTCFSTLSPKCRDEELEDLIYFILDLYQFHGVSIAISEVDVDQVTVDLRSALEEHVAARKRAKVVPVEDSHTFLVLDRQLQGIPWESIPALRGQSVSRIPSLEFLLDRIHLAQIQRKGRGDGHIREGDAEDVPIDRIRIDPRKTYYFLNPSGDLKGTEGRFASWLKEMHDVGWDGITGRAPSEQQFLNALSRKDLVIYFGHGGGEQYARSHKIRHLPRCAATMLWGCSSGSLRDMGEFDRVGTPYHYMVAGCPTLIANLWDVTDRDIDKFTQGVFDQLHLRPDEVRHHGKGAGEEGTSVVAAVARSRGVCKLKYLTGAAPVVYGIPFYL